MPVLRPLPLNVLTLYADLAQSMPTGPAAASISRRLEGGKRRLYATVKNGSGRRQIYLGTEGDAAADAAAAGHRRAAAEARVRRKTVSLLKRAGVPGPSLYAGRVLEALAGAGLFDLGAVLVGTAAFQLYPPLVGAALASSALVTQDADLAITRLAVERADGDLDLTEVLKRADPAFAPVLKAEDKLPKEFRSTEGFSVDIVTVARRTTAPVQMPSFGCAATPLKFLDYLIEDPIYAVALYGSGVPVRVPDPARYAVHKLIVAGLRRSGDPKSLKDIVQARELMAALDARDSAPLADALHDARSRGRSWKTRIDRGLALARSA